MELGTPCTFTFRLHLPDAGMARGDRPPTSLPLPPLNQGLAGPCLIVSVGHQPRSLAAVEMSARRLVTGFTLRAGPNSGSRSARPMAADSNCASSSRLVSLCLLYTS